MEDIVIKLKSSNPIKFTDTDNIVGYDILEFMDDLFDLLTQYLNKTQKYPDYDMNAAAAYTDIRKNPSIALRYKVKKRMPGQFDSSAPSASSLRNTRWIKVDELTDIKYPNYKIEIRKQIFDTEIELGIWSKNTSYSNQFSFELEGILDQYVPSFKKKGLIDLKYIGRGEDVNIEIGGTTWYLVPLVILVRTQKLKRDFIRQLDQVTLETDIYN